MMIEATYVDHMGTDLSVVNAARVSFGKKREALGTVTAQGSWSSISFYAGMRSAVGT